MIVTVAIKQQTIIDHLHFPHIEKIKDIELKYHQNEGEYQKYRNTAHPAQVATLAAYFR